MSHSNLISTLKPEHLNIGCLILRRKKRRLFLKYSSQSLLFMSLSEVGQEQREREKRGGRNKETPHVILSTYLTHSKGTERKRDMHEV